MIAEFTERSTIVFIELLTEEFIERLILILTFAEINIDYRLIGNDLNKK